jgi:hypothetical protein
MRINTNLWVQIEDKRLQTMDLSEGEGEISMNKIVERAEQLKNTSGRGSGECHQRNVEAR